MSDSGKSAISSKDDAMPKHDDSNAFENEANKELSKTVDKMKFELLEESERYANLSRAFEELYYQFSALVDEYENVINDTDGHFDPDRQNDCIHTLDDNRDFMYSIRLRSGIDKGRSSRPHRSSDAAYNFMNGSSLLRKASVTEGLLSKRSSGRVSVSGRFSHADDASEDSGCNDMKDLQQHRDSVGGGARKRGMSGIFHSLLPSPSLSRTTDIEAIPITLPHREGDWHPAVALGVDGNISDSHLLVEDAEPAVPLFEHFLVIGVSVDAAWEVSTQLKQKHERASSRMLNKIGSFLGGKTATALSRRTSNVSADTATSRMTFSARTSDASTTPPANRESMFSRLLSRDHDSESVSESQGGEEGRGRWGSMFKKSAAAAAVLVTRSESSDSAWQPPSVTGGDTAGNLTPLGGGSKNEHSTFTDPQILYRFPADAEPPPAEVCDFCMPSGGKLRHLQASDAETSVMEILYGQGQSQRSSRCFIFILEDKTLDMSKHHPNEELGLDTGRTYGICVVHPRLLNPEGITNGALDHLNDKSDSAAGDKLSPEIEFEASVCYCFITRFPLFDFFFKVIFNIITYERIVRMEKLAGNTSLLDRKAYEYIPEDVYTTVLEILTKKHPPKFNETLEFLMAPSLSPVTYTRSAPSGEYPEHFVNAAEWALPPLLHWLSAKIIAWALGLLMCEVKVIIIGNDPATVSCAVIGLTSLLKPLQWVSPMIPIMPLKHIDFLESPVPIIAGMVVDGDSVAPQSLLSDNITPLSLLQLCNDGESVTAVLDLRQRDIYTLTEHADVIPELIFPGAEGLIEKMQMLLDATTTRHSNDAFDFRHPGRDGVRREVKPQYNITKEELDTSRGVQDCILAHLKEVANNARSVAGDILKERMEAVEQKVRDNLQRIDRMKAQAPTGSSLSVANGSDGLTPVLEDDHDDDDNCDLYPHLPDMVVQDAAPAVTDSPMRRSSAHNQPAWERTRGDSPPLPIKRLNSSSSVSSSGMGSGTAIPLMSLFKERIDTSESGQFFMRRFVSTQLYSAYNQDLLDIMQTMEEVVHPDMTEERGSSSAAMRNSVGSSNSATSNKHGNNKRKSRSRSLYVVGDIHSNRLSVTDSTGVGGTGTFRKRSSSSASSGKSGTGLRRDMLS